MAVSLSRGRGGACVPLRADNEAVAINIDIEPVEKPETVLWVGSIHRAPG